jgi:hypothetical protein
VSCCPAFECGGLVHQAGAVRADLQDGATPVGHPTADDDRHAAARDERAQLDLPTLRESAQNGRQLFEPSFDLGEPRNETATDCSVDA